MIGPNELATDDDVRALAGVRLRAVERVPDHPDEARNVAAEQAVRDLLVALGEDPDRPGLRETPRRVAAAMTELLSPVAFTPTTFPGASENSWRSCGSTPGLPRAILTRFTCRRTSTPGSASGVT